MADQKNKAKAKASLKAASEKAVFLSGIWSRESIEEE
jgi:hypothetical protein